MSNNKINKYSKLVKKQVINDNKKDSIDNNSNIINNKNKDNNTIKTKNKGGRPKKIIDYDKVYELASLFCTQIEIGNILGFERTMFKDNKELSNIYKKGIDNAKSSLRRLQFKLAENNATMAIFLGKQYLEQRDKHEIDQNQTITRYEIINDLPKEK